MRYAMLNNRQRFIELTQQANRYNVSFYHFDTRGLAVFDRGLDAPDERLRNDSGEWYNRISGNAPGSPMHTGNTCVLGGAPNAVLQTQKILDAVSSCARRPSN